MITLANKEIWATIVDTKIVKDPEVPVKQEKRPSSTPEQVSDKLAKRAKGLKGITQEKKPELSCFNSLGQRLVVKQGQDNGVKVNGTTKTSVTRADVVNCLAQRVGGVTQIFEQTPMSPEDKKRMKVWDAFARQQEQDDRAEIDAARKEKEAFDKAFQH